MPLNLLVEFFSVAKWIVRLNSITKNWCLADSAKMRFFVAGWQWAKAVLPSLTQNSDGYVHCKQISSYILPEKIWQCLISNSNLNIPKQNFIMFGIMIFCREVQY
jgi:hypothetical protein